ncbi:MAG: lipoate--protein ligase family protein [Candidatus Helarchaeota archaeon]
MDSKKEWRLVVLKNLEPVRVQAIWHAMAESISATPNINMILITTTNKPSLSCGFHQNFYEEVDISYCKKHNIELIRRLAGGGLVLLDKEQVFYNVILNGYGFPTPVRTLYSYSLQGPNQFLKNLNLNSNINFNEISINNRKISGTGASSIENCGIVVGNIILDFDYDRFCDSLNVPNEEFRNLLKYEIRKNLTTLSNELNNNLSTHEVVEGLKLAFQDSISSKLREHELTEAEIDNLEKTELQYKQKNWNFRKNHEKFTERQFIKVKRGACIVHYPLFKSNFFISDAYIKKVETYGQDDKIKKIVGENIFKLKGKYLDYRDLQDTLIKFFELSNI